MQRRRILQKRRQDTPIVLNMDNNAGANNATYLDNNDDENDIEFNAATKLLSHVDGHFPTSRRDYDEDRRGSSSHRGRPRRRHSTKGQKNKYANYARDGSYSEHALETLVWYARGQFVIMVILLVLVAGALAAAIIVAVRVGPAAATMVSGMSKNVDTMTILGTGAPEKMATAWQQAKGDDLVSKGHSIMNRVDHMLERIEADPNLNDQFVNVAARITGKIDHLLSLITDSEWTQAKAHGLSILGSASEWSEQVPSTLVRETLEKGRDFSAEAHSLLEEARQQHLIKTLNDAGHAATELGHRAAQLDEITIKLPPVERGIVSVPRIAPVVQEAPPKGEGANSGAKAKEKTEAAP